MKTRETKQKDLNALTEELQNASSAMVVSFNKLKVTKDQEFRNKLRESGAKYQVVKNTLARIAVKGTQFEDATPHFKGVTGIAWTDQDAVILSKVVTKFVKDNADIYTFKAGVVEGKVYDAKQVETIASLPSKEELISKLMFVINSGAQRIVTVINAVPRNLAVVIKQIGEAKGDGQAGEQKTEPVAQPEPVSAPGEAAAIEEVKAEETEQPVAAESSPAAGEEEKSE
jgi:large subunit ribosomal protein L10